MKGYFTTKPMNIEEVKAAIGKAGDRGWNPWR